MARQLVLERLAVLDVEQGAAMEDVTLAMTALAEDPDYLDIPAFLLLRPGHDGLD